MSSTSTRSRIPNRLRALPMPSANGNGRRSVSTAITPAPASRPTSRPRRDPPPQNWLDRTISWLAPRWGARRALARLRVQSLHDFYDGATIGRRGASIRRSLADAVSITEVTLSRLRGGSRDLVRNNAWARRAIDVLTWNVVGTGIEPQFARGGERAQDIELLAELHLRTTDCDADGLLTYGGLLRLATRTMFESGEVLVRRRMRRPADGLAVPIQFQVLEPDYLDESKDRLLPGGGKIVQGVEFDAIGRRRGYWLFSEHPGSSRLRTHQSTFVPADAVIHLFDVDRPGQVRGVPRAAPIILKLADFADYEDAQLVRQKIAACFAGFITEPFDGGGFPGSAEKDGDDIIDTLEPGILERLPPGTEITFASPPTVENSEEYSRVSQRAIAAGMGISYEALTGDLKGTSFSGGRMGHLEFQRNIGQLQQLVVIPRLCHRMSAWFLEAAMLGGVATDGVTVRHIPPRREMIDPVKEGQADRDAIRGGQKTWTQVVRESGRDPAAHFDEYRADLDLLDELGITLDTDPRQRRSSAPPPPGDDEDDDEDDDE